jgi:hypothetical protein
MSGPIAANFDPHLIGAEYAYSAKADDLLPIYDADPKEEML